MITTVSTKKHVTFYFDDEHNVEANVLIDFILSKIHDESECIWGWDGKRQANFICVSTKQYLANLRSIRTQERADARRGKAVTK